MSISIKSEQTRTERTQSVTLEVDDAPIFQRPYTPTQRIKPTRVRLTLKKVEDEPWYVDGIHLSGPRMLTTGRPGTGLSESIWNSSEAPEWIRELVEERLSKLNTEN